MRDTWVNSNLPQGFWAYQFLRDRPWGHRRRRWPSWVSLALLGALLSVLNACMTVEHPLRVGTSIGIVSDNLYLAQELQYYPNGAVRLIDYPTTEDQLRAFRNRQVDVTAVPLSDALILAQTNPDLKGILVLSRSQGEDVLVTNRSISQLSDLAGKTIALEGSSRSRLMLAQVLEEANLSSQDVKVVTLSLGEQAEAFKRGEINAVVTHEPTRSSLLAAGGHDAFSGPQADNAMLNVLLVNGDTLKRNQPALIALTEGCLRVNAYVSSHPEEVSQRLAKRHQLSPEVMAQVGKAIQLFDLSENQRLLEPSGEELQQQAQLLSQRLQHQSLLGNYPISKLTWDNNIVKQLKDSA
jgi:NitT/TauT family transport system substrate-binding protein